MEAHRLLLRWKIASKERSMCSFTNKLSTADLGLPFKLLDELSVEKMEMVDPIGIEPTTSCMPCKRSPS